jgi:hypothetical protein
MRGFSLPRAAVIALLLIIPSDVAHVQAQKKRAKSARVRVASVAPRAEDVSSVDGIIKAFYEVISGPVGQPRQWARDRSLYIPGVRFVAIDVLTEGGSQIRADVMDHQTFVDRSNEFLVGRGFYEYEIHRVTRTFGNVTHVFSTYEGRQRMDGPVTERGINSLQLFFDGKRWWIASAVWDKERPGNPIPKEFLP